MLIQNKSQSLSVLYMCATGDEVLQWNGVPLQGRSAEEVSVVVADSKHDSHVELVVSRPITAARAPAQPWRTHKGIICSISYLSAPNFYEYRTTT